MAKQETSHDEERISLEQKVVDLLVKHKLTITTAESCTGGLLSGQIINVPGASEVFNLSVVTYANKAKRKILGVPKKTLKKHGAVSKKTAKAMAKGAAKYANADVAVVTTGIAGPDGGTKEKPVGLVCIGCYIKGHTEVLKCYFNGSREEVRLLAVAHALDFTQRCILEQLGE